MNTKQAAEMLLQGKKLITGFLTAETVKVGTGKTTGKPYLMHTVEICSGRTVVQCGLPTEQGATEKTVKRTGLTTGLFVVAELTDWPVTDKFGTAGRALSVARLEA